MERRAALWPGRASGPESLEGTVSEKVPLRAAPKAHFPETARSSNAEHADRARTRIWSQLRAGRSRPSCESAPTTRRARQAFDGRFPWAAEINRIEVQGGRRTGARPALPVSGGCINGRSARRWPAGAPQLRFPRDHRPDADGPAVDYPVSSEGAQSEMDGLGQGCVGVIAGELPDHGAAEALGPDVQRLLQ
jgi:hypothetical protein